MAVGEEEEEKESIQAFFWQSSEICRSEFIVPRTKVHLLNEGYVCVPKMRSFTEDPKEEIWGNKRFWAYEVFLRPLTISTTLYEVGILPTLAYLYLFGLILGGLLCGCLTGCLVNFMVDLRGCLTSFMG